MHPRPPRTASSRSCAYFSKIRNTLNWSSSTPRRRTTWAWPCTARTCQKRTGQWPRAASRCAPKARGHATAQQDHTEPATHRVQLRRTPGVGLGQHLHHHLPPVHCASVHRVAGRPAAWRLHHAPHARTDAAVRGGASTAAGRAHPTRHVQKHKRTRMGARRGVRTRSRTRPPGTVTVLDRLSRSMTVGGAAARRHAKGARVQRATGAGADSGGF